MRLADSVVEGVLLVEAVAGDVLLADTEEVGVMVLELVPELEGVPVGVGVEDREEDQDVLAELLALAPTVTELVGVADTVLGALRVELSVPLLLPVLLPVPELEAVTEDVAVADWLAVRLGLTVPLPVAEPVGLAERVLKGVAGPVGLRVKLPVAVPLGLGGGEVEGVALGVPVALPGASVDVPEAVREGDTVAVGEESTHWTALGRYIKPTGQRG